ncbi:hypothetical protein CYMTET_54584 [Cymbomonas tetramitiformis]|uniref:Uncharacterized protein n=1 Tax=Cymbomonas tetramitiformis TaxID=36881 RepID=A0AAE0EQK2_9CHLO|nr:hypothetical protein CYMTET_54584 [Cymbomonas tetramitiformis]
MKVLRQIRGGKTSRISQRGKDGVKSNQKLAVEIRATKVVPPHREEHINWLKSLLFDIEWFKARRKRYRDVGLLLAWVGFYYLVLVQQQPDFVDQFHCSSILRSVFPGVISVEETSTRELRNKKEVDAWVTTTVQNIWQDSTCGDGNCNEPFERPEFQAPGFSSNCQTDCGLASPLYAIIVILLVDFTNTQFGSANADWLRSSASWNLCLNDEKRTNSGLDDECWYNGLQDFPRNEDSIVKEFLVVPGNWYLTVEGDFYRTVQGKVLDASNVSDPRELITTPIWQSCSDEAGVSRRSLLIDVKSNAASMTASSAQHDERPQTSEAHHFLASPTVPSSTLPATTEASIIPPFTAPPPPPATTVPPSSVSLTLPTGSPSTSPSTSRQPNHASLNSAAHS